MVSIARAGQELYAKAPGPKELLIIEGAGHMDLYDGEGLGTAVSKLALFFKGQLKSAKS